MLHSWHALVTIDAIEQAVLNSADSVINKTGPMAFGFVHVERSKYAVPLVRDELRDRDRIASSSNVPK